MAGWETYEPPQTTPDESGKLQNSGKWLFTVLALILFINILVVEVSIF
jgi:hypothetical protein